MILQRSEPSLGAMPHAVGRYFSGNGERLNTAVIDEDRARDVLGLDRGGGVAYAANQIGRGPSTANWDRLDETLPEYSRFSLEQLYFPRALGPSSRRRAPRTVRRGSVWRRRRCSSASSRG